MLVIRVQDLYFSISLDITPGDLKLMKHTYFAVALEPGHEINVMLIPLEELLVTDVTSVKQIGSSRFPNKVFQHFRGQIGRNRRGEYNSCGQGAVLTREMQAGMHLYRTLPRLAKGPFPSSQAQSNGRGVYRSQSPKALKLFR
ncbi:hypothetical protein D3C73_1262720 [compost metagenome]